ncbi:hypothetical protein STCU_10321 [Strigomonas culicis]|uniref:Uncharacterized protein n=1 Tax=Strigomonas culicis TaxID=28005 RepID=S9V4U7_9TRYP|nr:hypothetical protein STCU_10321 [Strigomonas culicis]|eukprot:EPY17915.1 hypothetical protein STCU_10321 [Strigomonas culicis]
MGHSAKITRGGNKKRVNQARQEAKQKAQGAKAHTTTVQETMAAKRALKQRSHAIAEQLKAKAGPVGSGPVVRMAAKPAKKEDKQEE